jgi:integrase
MFNLAIDSKLRGCDLVNLHVRDVTHGNQVWPRAMVVQRKTQRPMQFELTEPTRPAVSAWVEKANLRPEHYLFPQSPGEIAPCLYPPVRQDRASVGRRHRTRFDGLWHAHHATDPGDTDLQANQEPTGRPTLARS